MAAQDDIREKSQMKLFGLIELSETNRSNTYKPDGKKIIDGKEVTYELKTGPEKYLKLNKKTGLRERKNKTSLSTARGFNPYKMDEWKTKTDLYIFSLYSGLDFNGSWKEHWIMTYEDLEPWLIEKVATPFYEGRKPRKNSPGYYGMKEYEEHILPLIKDRLSEEDLKRVEHTLEVGTSLNDPPLPWSYIKKHGTRVYGEKDIDDFYRSRFMNSNNKKVA